MRALAAAYINAEFMLNRRQTALQGADDAGRDPGGMPIHAHDGAEGLKPEGVGEAPQEFVAAIFVDDGLGNHAPERRHPG